MKNGDLGDRLLLLSLKKGVAWRESVNGGGRISIWYWISWSSLAHLVTIGDNQWQLRGSKGCR